MGDNRNLKELSNIESVRQRPGNIFGTNDMEGEVHGINEVIMNSCDEAKEGFGKKITINIEEKNIITVEDEGRGIPMGWNSDAQKFNWEIALCTLYGSGKYDSSQYTNVAGLNGLGLTAMQFASEFMEVTSTYDGIEHYIEFKQGIPQCDLIERQAAEGKHGTKIRFKPDPKVFVGAEDTIPVNEFIDILRKQAMVIPGLEININHCNNKPITFKFDNGTVDFIDTVIPDRMNSTTAYYEDSATGIDDDKINSEPYNLYMRLAFSFSSTSGMIEVYHNGAHMFEQTQNKTLDALKKGFVAAFMKFGKDEGKIAKGEQIQIKDIDQILVCIGETECPGYRTFFKNQTKGAITNPFIVTEFQRFVTSSVTSWLSNNKKESVRVLDRVIANKKAREEADRVSKKAIAKLTKKSTVFDRPDGLYECESKNPEECEIYIVEGKSAVGSVGMARDPRFQAALGLTGKPLNCIKNRSLSIIINNKVIQNMYRALQCGIERKSRYMEDLPKFDINKLRYDKIIIAADADVDGKHIVILVIAIIYVLTPTLIRAGKVYIAESPLFEIVYNNKSVFAYSNKERDDILNRLESNGANMSRVAVHRSKGLGENDSDMMELTTMSPKTRRLTRVKFPEDEKQQEILDSIFETVLGNDIEGRRMMIEQYFSITADITD